MKLTALLLLTFCLHVSAKVFAQHITFSGRNVHLETIFSAIERQTEYVIFYDKAHIRRTAPHTIRVVDQPLEAFLNQVLVNTPLEYSIRNRTIIIKRKAVTPSGDQEPEAPVQDEIPPIEVRGRVTDAAGRPLEGVSIVVKGTNIGAVTDSRGHFSISIPDNASKVLVFSYVGMAAREVPVESSTTLNIALEGFAGQEQEVVVRGYGTQKKANLSGSVASIGGELVRDRPVTNVSQALQGQLPGVQIAVYSGQPGRDRGRIKIRGTGTMNNADPMIVVDGIVVNTWEDINPYDIENVTVLKDAAAAAIYGSRAANGVLIITTKRGQTGEPQLTYNAYVGKQSLTTVPDFLPSHEYAMLLNEGLMNEGAPPRYTAEEIEKFRNGSDPWNYPNTDWLGLLYTGSGMIHNHNISLTGGTASSRYLLSLGYLDQHGVMPHTRSDRYNIRLNLDSKISDKLQIGLTSNLSRQRIIEPTMGIGFIISQLERVPPTELNKNQDGSWVRYIDGNHIWDASEDGVAHSLVSHAYGNIFAELEMLPGLKWRSTAGVDFTLTDVETQRKDITFGNGIYQGPNWVQDDITRFMRVTLQTFMTYQKTFGDHALGLLAGAEREANRMDINQGYRQGFPNNELTELNAGGQPGWRNSGSMLETRLGSYLGRVNYAFRGKYILEGNLRYDGSSKFAEDTRWGLFPSFSAAWRISEEPFMLNQRIFSDLKIRGSYGALGNNATADYQFLPRIALGQNYPFNNIITSGAAQTSSANSLLQWEKSTSFNIGIDAGLFGNRLTITADYYDRLTSDILIAIPVSPLYGLPAPTVNAGAMRNRGVEILVGYRGDAGDFNYHITGNISFNKNRVEKFPNPVITTANYQLQTIKQEGYEWDAFYGYEVDGLYQTQEQIDNAPKFAGSPVRLGDIRFRDQNKDGVIDGKDRVVLGSDIPGVTFGINMAFTWKNFDLNLFGQGVTDFHQKITMQYMTAFSNGGKAMRNHLDRWTPETPHSKFPRTAVTQQYNWAVQSTLNVIDATYFRLKNLQLGYTIPERVVSRLGIDRLRAYLSCQNVFTLTGMYPGIDPEAAYKEATGYDGKYNPVRVLTAGINLTL